MRPRFADTARLRGSAVLVTGASRGVGAALARALHAAGASVALTSRSADALGEVAASIRHAGSECIAIPGDVSSASDVQQAVDQTVRQFGRIDVLINNAGICRYGPFESATLEDFQDSIDINLKGPILTSRAVLPIMRAQRRGEIFNVASIAGLWGIPNLAFYSASKFALVGFSQALGRELVRDNIRVSYVCPGWVNTEMLEAFPASLLPERSTMISPQSLAELIVESLQAPLAAPKSRLHRGIARLAKRFKRDSIPVYRSL